MKTVTKKEKSKKAELNQKENQTNVMTKARVIIF